MTFEELANRCGWVIGLGDDVAIAEYKAQARTAVIEECAKELGELGKCGSSDREYYASRLAQSLRSRVCKTCNGKGSILYTSTAPWIAEGGEPIACGDCK
jgi:hypothetical protein